MAPNLLDVTDQRPAAQDHRVDDEAGLGLHARSRDGRADLADRRDAGAAERSAGRADVGRRSRFRRSPAPYSQQGLLESDLIDYTPAIKDSALKLAQKCRMGPYFIPGVAGRRQGQERPSQYTCSWYAPGASGGVNIDGGTAADPETGMIYVGGQSGMSTIAVAEGSVLGARYTSPHNSCGKLGAAPPPPGYSSPAAAEGAGRGGGFAARRARRHGDRRRLDPQAEGDGRHHRVRHEHRRQEVVGAERQPVARADDAPIRSSPA